jgi:hypothetical protein
MASKCCEETSSGEQPIDGMLINHEFGHHSESVLHIIVTGRIALA